MENLKKLEAQYAEDFEDTGDENTEVSLGVIRDSIKEIEKLQHNIKEMSKSKKSDGDEKVEKKENKEGEGDEEKVDVKALEQKILGQVLEAQKQDKVSEELAKKFDVKPEVVNAVLDRKGDSEKSNEEFMQEMGFEEQGDKNVDTRPMAGMDNKFNQAKVFTKEELSDPAFPTKQEEKLNKLREKNPELAAEYMADHLDTLQFDSRGQKINSTKE